MCWLLYLSDNWGFVHFTIDVFIECINPLVNVIMYFIHFIYVMYLHTYLFWYLCIHPNLFALMKYCTGTFVCIYIYICACVCVCVCMCVYMQRYIHVGFISASMHLFIYSLGHLFPVIMYLFIY